MEFFNHFLVNPERFRIPQYAISPFSHEWIKTNYALSKSDQPVNKDLLSHYFGHYLCFESGRSALSCALAQYGLSTDDEVWILTTTGNRYISGCVTREIEKYCKWSRQQSEKTKLILVNHEFGTVYRAMDEVLKFNLPVIEDMAMSMFSTDDNRQTGNYGDFTIFSLPKFFPVQWGGILKINNPSFRHIQPITGNPFLSQTLLKYVSFYLADAASINQLRKQNNILFQNHLGCLDFKNRFTYSENETPAVYMCSTPSSVNLDGLKVFLQQNGVESSVFYGENAFFVPVHQYLKEEDILFIVSLIKYYCNDNK